MRKKKIKITKEKIAKEFSKKAFTLIELLAVIIILGILMIVAIPAVTSYIQNSRKSSYVTTAQNVVAGARTMVNSGRLDVYDPDTTYYIPYKMIQVENAVISPYGDIEKAYVVVVREGDGFSYYWTCIDSSRVGMYITKDESLNEDSVVTDMEDIVPNIGIGHRSKIVVFNDDGTIDDSITRPLFLYNVLTGEIGEAKFPVCKRATSLHTAACENGVYASSTLTNSGNKFCKGDGYVSNGTMGTTTITFGSLGTSGVLTPGDAFDCDVNGDGIYDSTTERFYYISPKDGDDSSDYATLIYYNNVSGGLPSNSNIYAYATAYYIGPNSANSQLPTTSQWSNVSLSTQTRQIKNSVGGTTIEYGGSTNNLRIFTYTGRAARLMTVPELVNACGDAVTNKTGKGINERGYLKNCNFLLENTTYVSEDIGNRGYYLETWSSQIYYVHMTSAGDRDIGSVVHTTQLGIRPVIEVLKSDIEIELNN